MKDSNRRKLQDGLIPLSLLILALLITMALNKFTKK